MTNQELLQAVYARLGGKPDSAPEPLILAKVQEAIKSVTKELVYSGNPMSHLLIKSVTHSSVTTKEGDLFYKDLTGILKTGTKFLTVTRSDNKKIEPTNSWDALSELPKKHNHPYYKWHNNRVYISVPDAVAPANVTFTIEHYHYLTLSEFPYDLVDILLSALIPMLVPQAPQPEPKKNEGKKKQ